MKTFAEEKETDVIHQIFLPKVKSPKARQSLEYIYELSNMVIFYARIRAGAEELEETWNP
ncbi:MAG: hypothetical protein IKW90_12550 [Lachnospiraceae bacterium]|nr:hypothetical protein [Lachnospiraceae bacterium]